MGKLIRKLWPVATLLALCLHLGSAPLRAERPSDDAPFWLYTLSSALSDVETLNAPLDVAVAPDGSVYVLDSGNQRVQRFSAEGLFQTAFGSYGSRQGQFNDPERLAIGPDGSVYVADTWNHRIQRFDANGAFLGEWGASGSGPQGQESPEAFSGAFGLAVGPTGTVYVADSEARCLRLYTPSGALLTVWPSAPWGSAAFLGEPYGLAVAADSAVWVADISGCRVIKLAADGAFVGAWGQYGTGNRQFNTPYRPHARSR